MSEVSGLTAALNKKYDSSEAETLSRTVNGYKETMARIEQAQDDQSREMENLRNTLTDRSYTLDFGQTGTVVQDVNMEREDVIMLEFRLFNVRKLMVTSGELVRYEVDPQTPGDIIIAGGGLATWEIERESDELAAVGVRCRRVQGTSPESEDAPGS